MGYFWIFSGLAFGKSRLKKEGRKGPSIEASQEGVWDGLEFPDPFQEVLGPFRDIEEMARYLLRRYLQSIKDWLKDPKTETSWLLLFLT